MSVHTVERPPSEILGLKCSKGMKGKTVKKDGGFRPSWTKPCPNNASVIHRGRAYCAMHAPAKAKKPID